MIQNIVWLTLETHPDEIDQLVSANEGLPRYFRIDTSAANQPEHDVMKLALRNASAKALVVELTNLGFSLYYNTANESRFIRNDRIIHHWPAVKDGTFLASDDGIVHQLELPESGQVDRLVVVFSPINSKPRLIRYFRPSFATLLKYVPRNTAILRIADVGGVKGAFYLDTTALPDNSAKIRHLIRSTLDEHSVKDRNVVLFGASKGGTGAFFHGLTSKWKFVAVDPILSDVWYEENENDYHFTTRGIFPRSKQEIFTDLVRKIGEDGADTSLESVLITSSRSPQYSRTSEIIQPVRHRLSIFDSGNPEILKHPDVAPKTIYAQVMALNTLLLGFELPTDESAIP